MVLIAQSANTCRVADVFSPVILTGGAPSHETCTVGHGEMSSDECNSAGSPELKDVKSRLLIYTLREVNMAMENHRTK